MPKNTYITFGAPVVGQEEIKGVVEVLKSGWLGTGPKTAEFEEMVRDYVGAKYAIGVSSCTAALHLSLLMAGVGSGDEVITSPLTFASTANVILHIGAKVIFADVNRETRNIDPEMISKRITRRTKVIIPVHLAGRPCEMEEITRLGNNHKLEIIEDAAHALGAAYKNKKVGVLSKYTCFSFYVTKNIMTGEGGMITTNNKDVAERLKIYRLHGLSKDAWKRYSANGYRHYDVAYPGYKYNLIDLLSVIGLAQMSKIEKMTKRRKQVWEYYDRELKNVPIETPKPWVKDYVHARHLYSILVDERTCRVSRDKFMEEMHKKGIGTGIHFYPVHLHSYYRRFGYKRSDYPNAEFIGDRTVSIPLTAKLSDNEVARIVKTIKNIILRA